MNRQEYSPDWADIIRPAILKRDNYCCRVCGIRHKSVVYKNSIGNYVICDEFTQEWAKANNKRVFTLFLQVAHLNHNKEDNRPENLMTLCPRHHSKYDADHKKLQRISYREKIRKTQISNVPQSLSEHASILSEIQHAVKQVTAVSILKHEAEIIFNLILKSITNEQD